MNKGVRVLNCARGGIINEADLYAAIQSGQVGGAALDVYETEPPAADFPLRELPQVIMTPHLGASTEEAQENVGIEVAEAITDFLVNGAVRNAVNLPNLDAQTYQAGQAVPDSGRKTGPSAGPTGPQTQRPHRHHLRRQGRGIADRSRSLAPCSKASSNWPAARRSTKSTSAALAASLGLLIEEIKSSEATDFNEWLHVAVLSGDGKNLRRRERFRRQEPAAHRAPQRPAGGDRPGGRAFPDEQQRPAGHCRLHRHPDGQTQRSTSPA